MHICTYTCIHIHTYIHIYTYIYIHTHIHISLLCQLSGPRNINTPGATKMASIQNLVSNTFSKERNQGFLKKWLIFELAQKIYEIGWNQLVAPGSNYTTTNDGHMSKRYRSQLKEFPLAKSGAI